VLPGRAGSHPESVLAGQATLQPFGEDGFGLVPQGPVSVLGDGAWIEQARRGARRVGVVGVPGAALGAHHHVAAAAVEPADGPAVGADVQAQLVARISGGSQGSTMSAPGRHWVTHV
jgi:hypothetical protein